MQNYITAIEDSELLALHRLKRLSIEDAHLLIPHFIRKGDSEITRYFLENHPRCNGSLYYREAIYRGHGHLIDLFLTMKLEFNRDIVRILATCTDLNEYFIRLANLEPEYVNNVTLINLFNSTNEDDAIRILKSINVPDKAKSPYILQFVKWRKKNKLADYLQSIGF